MEGRTFDPRSVADYKEAFIVNEAAVRAYGWRDGGGSPIGRRIEAMNYEKKGTVVGVLKDVNLYSLHNKVQPLIFNLSENLPFVYVRLQSENLQETMGLFALSAFLVVQRTKEIGVRKVLGASVKEIVMLLSKEYVSLIVIANVVAIAVSYFLAQQWLAGYAYRVSISWFLLVPLVVTMSLAFLSLSYQVFNASLANPVRSLKYE